MIFFPKALEFPLHNLIFFPKGFNKLAPSRGRGGVRNFIHPWKKALLQVWRWKPPVSFPPTRIGALAVEGPNVFGMTSIKSICV